MKQMMTIVMTLMLMLATAVQVVVALEKDAANEGNNQALHKQDLSQWQHDTSRTVACSTELPIWFGDHL